MATPAASGSEAQTTSLNTQKSPLDRKATITLNTNESIERLVLRVQQLREINNSFLSLPHHEAIDTHINSVQSALDTASRNLKNSYTNLKRRNHVRSGRSLRRLADKEQAESNLPTSGSAIGLPSAGTPSAVDEVEQPRINGAQSRSDQYFELEYTPQSSLSESLQRNSTINGLNVCLPARLPSIAVRAPKPRRGVKQFDISARLTEPFPALHSVDSVAKAYSLEGQLAKEHILCEDSSPRLQFGQNYSLPIVQRSLPDLRKLKMQLESEQVQIKSRSARRMTLGSVDIAELKPDATARYDSLSRVAPTNSETFDFSNSCGSAVVKQTARLPSYEESIRRPESRKSAVQSQSSRFSTNSSGAIGRKKTRSTVSRSTRKKGPRFSSLGTVLLKAPKSRPKPAAQSALAQPHSPQHQASRPHLPAELKEQQPQPQQQHQQKVEAIIEVPLRAPKIRPRITSYSATAVT